MKIAGFIKKYLPVSATVRKIFLVSVITVIVILLFFVSVQNVVLEKGLDRLALKFASAGYRLTWKDSRFIHFNEVFVSKLLLESEKDSSRFMIDSLAMKFGVFHALRGHLSVKTLACNTVSVRVDLDRPVMDTNQPITTDGPVKTPDGTNYSLMVNRIIHRLFMAVPRRLDIDTVKITIRKTGNDQLLTFLESTIVRGAVHSYFYSGEKTDTTTILLEGRINHKKLSAELFAHSALQRSCILSFAGEHPVTAGFDSLQISLSFLHYSNKLVTIRGTSVSKGLTLEGERLSSQTISIDRLSSSFILHVKPQSIELDSASAITVNRISLHPYAFISNDPQLKMDLKICPVTWDAGTFFRSVPAGLFTSLTGFDATGDLHFFLNFSLDMKSVDSLQFSSRLYSDNFKILHYGIDDYRLLNSEFIHHFYDRGSLVAAFPVGPSNPDFDSLAGISPWLKISVLTSEDGGFYNHRGFNPDAIRESMITNIKEGRFVRGGSTISMQLVKNVFLTRNKTIGRKLEELLIVWIIENNHLAGKDRMFEVYLNIIEWGPGIFGIRQASRYYFDKDPADLNLQESLFLAGIIPFPKRFKSVFESNGFPKTWFENYMQRMKDLMVARNRILPADTTGVDTRVFLTGPASRVFISADTLKADTLKPNQFLFSL
jgi:Transglycosylase